MAKINKERTTKQVMEIAKDQIRECKKLQVQFNGRIPAFQAGYAGSIPATCSK